MQQNNYPNPPYQVMEEEDTIDLRKLLFKYLRFWPWIVVSAGLGVILAVFFTRIATPIYKVEGTVLIQDGSPSLGADLFDGAGGMFGGKNNIENEVGILKSYTLAEEAVRKMNLNVSYFKDGIFSKPQLYGNVPIHAQLDWKHPQITGGLWKIKVLNTEEYELSIEEDNFSVFNPADPFYKTKLENVQVQEGRYKFGETIEGDHFKFSLENTSALAEEVLFVKFMDTPTLAQGYREKVQVAPTNKQASLLNITLETPVRRLGEDYLNHLMEAYLDRELKIKNQASENTVRFIDRQLSGITDSLTFFEDRLQKYRSDNRIFNLSQEGSIVFERLESLEKEKSEAELRKKYYTNLREYLSNEQLDDLTAPSVIGIQDPLLNALVINLAELQSERVRLSANFSDQTPAVVEVKNKIQNTRKTLLENVRSALTNTENILAELNQKVKMVERDINALPETERNLLGIQRQFSINENIYVYLLQKRAESEITKASNMPNNSILDFARAGALPISPKKSLSYLIGLILGLMLPIGVITVRDFLKTKIEDADQLQHDLKVPLLSQIGKSKAADKRVVFSKPRSMVTESFRNLRADMAYLVPHDQDTLTLSFTSTISGEGKTFVAYNTAAVYSLIGKKTLIMGLDLRKPRIAEDFDINYSKGISNVLSSNMDWREAVVSSGFPDCDVLLAGPTPPNPAELLMTEKFARMMEEVKEEYDVIIMDCPPVGLVSETKDLFKYADINLFVFRQNYSHQDAIQFVNELKAKGDVKNLYAIFNAVEGSSGTYGYGYGYGSKSYGYHEEEEKKKWYSLK
ncbi:polysaccharide biosynthesis tyrosine autokinase [Litoribacter alkaliphilus]|uniref:non-specific protein-tyrosine kinase n=1 Tax=Litoribacter ruber TaxID=702568 RepID=A0AAP2G6N7_9BACT|nr:polysaccharide biosynthesis tyrosine autokinase [Litoribacter alkaliphilus]MBS9525893.1 polysaccharide biosynthesis tyrosine autokinase [Litoribacter alkaliphilus]